VKPFVEAALASRRLISRVGRRTRAFPLPTLPVLLRPLVLLIRQPERGHEPGQHDRLLALLYEGGMGPACDVHGIVVAQLSCPPVLRSSSPFTKFNHWVSGSSWMPTRSARNQVKVSSRCRRRKRSAGSSQVRRRIQLSPSGLS
jgi:hypothetical protein